TNLFEDILVSEQVFWGAEGQAYFGDVTVGGQLAKQDFVNQRDFSGQSIVDDGWVANIEGKYFINDNWRVDLGFNYNKTKFNDDFLGSGSSESLNQKTYSIGTEYRLENKPFSFYAQFNRNEIKLAGFDFEDNQYIAGIKINFGSVTLKGRDRIGASLDPIAQQPAGAMILGNTFDNFNGFVN
ncbi:MAG: opacity protein-like surface antigen, partial [Alteromonadaceae bacterium]